MQRWLESVWYDPSGARGRWLQPLGVLFGLLVALRRVAFERGLLHREHPGVPVVVIGNLTVGGTGKTPFTIWLANELRARGIVAGVLARGYGAPVRGPVTVEARSDPRDVGDEPTLIRAATGVTVVVSPERLAGAARLCAAGVELILCDDGLQHLALQRDLEIVLVDGQRGLGNGRLLPAGPLREAANRLARHDFIVFSEPGETLPEVPAGPVATPVFRCGWRRRSRGGWSTLEDGRNAGILQRRTGCTPWPPIGNPARFFQTLRSAGLVPLERPFPDHHPFSRQDLRFDDDLAVLMTSKDAVKCRSFADSRMWEVPVTGVHRARCGLKAIVDTCRGCCPAPRHLRPHRPEGEASDGQPTARNSRLPDLQGAGRSSPRRAGADLPRRPARLSDPGWHSRHAGG